MSDTIYNYYVYAYINKRTGLPYYIGKGKERRAFNNHGRVSVPKDKRFIVFCETNLSNVGACAIERQLIQRFGRKDLGTGILLNMTPGGDSGLADQPRPEHVRNKISESLKGRANTWAKPHSHQTKDKIAKSLTGRTRTIESREKQRQSQLAREPIQCPHCGKVGKSNMNRWHFDNCKHKTI